VCSFKQAIKNFSLQLAFKGIGVVGCADVQRQIVPRLSGCDAEGPLSELKTRSWNLGRSQHFPVPDLSSFLFPSPSLLRSDPLIYSYLGSDVSSAGAEPRPTTHYVPLKLLIEAGSLIQAASSIEARNRGGFY